jgi:hypothetical protein
MVVVGAGILAGTWLLVRDDRRDAPEPPAEPKTPAELIVGKWKRVSRTPPINSPTQKTVEYTPEGTVIVWKEVPSSELHLDMGVYRVEGNTLVRTWEGDAREFKQTIESITPDRLVISGLIDEQRYITEYERVLRK